MNNSSRILVNVTDGASSVFAEYQTAFVAFMAVTLVICVAGSLLFLLPMAVVLRQRRLFRSSRLLIANQSFMEFQLLVVHLPLAVLGTYLAETRNSALFYNDRFCTVQLFINLSTVVASLWGLFILAVNRYIAVTFINPERYRRWTSSGVQLLQIAFVWIVGFSCHLYFLAVPLGGAATAGRFPFKGCIVRSGTALLLKQIFGHYLPVGLTALTYLLLMMRFLWARHQRRVHPDTAGVKEREGRAFQRRVLLWKIFLLAAAVHCVTFLLQPVAVFLFPYSSRHPIVSLWTRIVFNLGQLSTPIMLIALSKDCRAGIAEVCQCSANIRRKRRETAFSMRSTERSRGNTLTKNTDSWPTARRSVTRH
ncbi:uncharacterized protein LOC129592385 [Paramacrobiotus metropolitanus]|uniref:uncharacterized protein LOC129592385 n=1 Tax=Paramacrobiotus metropolitanus TaxID=2943436 RepID=UPI0024461D06|nr:uncharacterized protein LOC129592385 [Paramacrobiotus metropolitanus]